MYVPRVVGARVGQAILVRNSDDLLHNVHGVSGRGNGFNVGQPKVGIVQELRLKEPETMVRVACDVHRWMTAFVGVVSHPYFATSGAGGTFTIANVPAGTHTIQAWHELFGVVTQTVRVTEGSTSTVGFQLRSEVIAVSPQRRGDAEHCLKKQQEIKNSGEFLVSPNLLVSCFAFYFPAKTAGSIGALIRTSLISKVSRPFNHPNVHRYGILMPAPGTSR